ncbi:MAG TPA: DUF6755 family protein [Acidobacteriota bacterium]|jgi:hypothetical protein
MSDIKDAQKNITAQKRNAILAGIISILCIFVIAQVWLLTAALEAYLAGNPDVAIPAALVAAGCFALAAGLLRYLPD